MSRGFEPRVPADLPRRYHHLLGHVRRTSAKDGAGVGEARGPWIEASQVSSVHQCLGHRVSREGVQPIDSKIQAGKDRSTPLKSYRPSLGWSVNTECLLRTLRRLLHPPTRCCQEKCQVHPEQVLQELKRLLTSAPSLAYADYNLPQTHGSLKGLGAVLTEQDGKEQMIAYARRLLE